MVLIIALFGMLLYRKHNHTYTVHTDTHTHAHTSKQKRGETYERTREENKEE